MDSQRRRCKFRGPAQGLRAARLQKPSQEVRFPGPPPLSRPRIIPRLSPNGRISGGGAPVQIQHYCDRGHICGLGDGGIGCEMPFLEGS
jgi:hypothetical protein